MYKAPYIDDSGLHIPSYQDIVDYLVLNFKNLYGQSVYLGNDSADYQILSVFALSLADTLQGIQMAYNSRSPSTAIGAALDALVKLNGIARKDATYSTCTVIVSGAVGTNIYNGVVGDINGKRWDLPGLVTIPVGGNINVIATCEDLGAVAVEPGQITQILTPQSGWTNIANAVAAVPGRPVETDSQLRGRQALSTALAARTTLNGTIAAIAGTPGVGRYRVIENNTGSTDSYGTPGHSITAIVEGGDDADVADAIYKNRGIGCYTNGTTSVNITDSGGITTTIRFSRPTYLPMFVTMNIFRLTGYSSALDDQIKQAVVDYLNSLQIGEMLTRSGVIAAAMSVTNLDMPEFSLRELYIDITPDPTATTDYSPDFDEVTQGVLENMVLGYL